MKHLIITFFVLVFTTLSSSAQIFTSAYYSPDADKFISESGDYLYKDVYSVYKSKIDLKVVILTSFETGEKIGYVDYTSQDATGNTMKTISAGLGTYAGEINAYVSSLDYAELEKCIACLEYARENLLGKLVTWGEERYFYYTTRLGGRIGVKNTGGQWYAFVNADPYGSEDFERAVLLSGKGFDKIVDAFKQAKTMIEEKTK